MATFDVLLPVRNGISFLHEAVDSIRNQTFSDWRLLILDHGSQDGSLELSQRYAEEDTRIKAFAFPTADGLADLLNQGLEMCDCKYMLRQDADDISLPNRMSIVKDRIGDNPDIVAIGSDLFTIDKTGRQIAYLRLPTSPMAVTAATFFYNPMAHPTIAASFAALKRYGARYGVDILHAVSEADSLTVKQLAEDYFLYGQLALLGLCANVGLPLVKCRRHSGSVGAKNTVRQIELSLQISRFFAKSYSIMKGVSEFDPAPFCNHADHVFDLQLRDYTSQFEQMAAALRHGLGESLELERELAFRRILATRDSGVMVTRYLQFYSKHGVSPSEWRTVRNWLLRKLRRGKYVYCLSGPARSDKVA